MADSKASEAGRELIRARWGNRVVSRAVDTVIERRDELDAAQLEQLAAVLERKDAGEDAP
jgi:hypothetical protein